MKICILSVLYFFLTNSAVWAADTLIFSKPGPNDYAADISESVLEEAYAQLDIKVSTHTFPAERSLSMSNAGQVDGEVNRIFGIEQKYANLVRIPVAINWIEGIAYTNKKNTPILDWESLRPYSIGIRIGTKFAEIGTNGMNVKAVTSNDQMFMMLDNFRVDVVISTRMEGMLTSRRLNLKNISALEPPLARFKLFHYLHTKHKNLVPRLTRILKNMESEGRIREIRNTVIAELFDKETVADPLN